MGDLEEDKSGSYAIAIAVGVIIVVGITLIFIQKKLPALMASIKNIFGLG